MTRDEALKKYDEFAAAGGFAGLASGAPKALDLSFIIQLLPIFAAVFPILMPIVPIIQKLLELFFPRGGSIPVGVLEKLDAFLDECCKEVRGAGSTAP